MRRTLLLPLVLGLLISDISTGYAPAQLQKPTLSMAHFPVFRRELMQSQLNHAYGDLPRRWGAPVNQLVLNSYCDSWRALHGKTYAVQGIPGHWLQQANHLGYTVLVGVITDEPYTLLLTRAKTDEQLQSLLNQQSVATPDRLAAVTSIGRRYLATTLKVADHKIRLAEMSYDDMPLLSLVQGRYQAALTSPNVYTRMQSALKQDMRLIRIPSPPLRAAIVVDPAQLGADNISRLRELLLDINDRARAHGVRYVEPDEATQADKDQPAVDSSHCPLVP